MSKFTSVQVEHLQDIIDTDGLRCLIALMHLKVDTLGVALLTEDLSKTSFANLGIATAKYQGAKELVRFIESELVKYKALGLKQK